MTEEDKIDRCEQTDDMFGDEELKTIYYLTPLKHLDEKRKEVALAWKYKKFRVSEEKNNKYDKYACKVEKWNNEDWIQVGYIQRFSYETIFTEKADELYHEAMIMNNWEEMKAHPNWADIEEVKKTEIISPKDIDLLIENQNQFKLLTDRDNYEWRLYLEKR